MTLPHTVTTCALVLATGALARAQTTSLIFEASRDFGVSWHTNLDASPDDFVVVQVRVGLSGTSTVLGLAGVTFQPTLTNWHSGDSVLPFNVPCDFPPFCDTPPGRVLPFASSGMNSASASGILTSHLDPGNVLRFAGANALTPTTNLAWGVSCGQVPPSIGGSNFREGTDPVIFRYGVRLSPTNSDPRDLVASVPVPYILQQRGSWYRTNTGTQSLLAPITTDTIIPATIRVVPSPPSLISMVALVILASRRRR